MSPAKEITEVYFYAFLGPKFLLSSLRLETVHIVRTGKINVLTPPGSVKTKGLKNFWRIAFGFDLCIFGIIFNTTFAYVTSAQQQEVIKIWIGKAKVNLFLGDDILNSLLWWYANSLYYAAIQQMSSKLARGYTQPISKFLPCVLPAATP